jgi:hypothetical protein
MEAYVLADKRMMPDFKDALINAICKALKKHHKYLSPKFAVCFLNKDHCLYLLIWGQFPFDIGGCIEFYIVPNKPSVRTEPSDLQK